MPHKQMTSLLVGLTTLAMLGCPTEAGPDTVEAMDVTRSAFVDDPKTAFRESVPIGPMRALQITRPARSAIEVIVRARAMAVVITQDTTFPVGNSIDPQMLSYWEEAARGQPHRPGTVNVYLNGHNLSATYLPATDTISVLSKDIVDRSPLQLIPGEKAVGIGVAGAQAVAEGCVDELAARGAIPARIYSRTPIQAGERVTAVGEKAWVEQYDFVYAPRPGGVALRSMDIRVGVSAQSGRCRSLTISMVDFQEADTVVLVVSEEQAKAFVESTITKDPLISSVAVEGYIGYLLGPDESSGLVEPRYIASYSTTTKVDGHPLVSRKKTVAISLTSTPSHLEPIYDW
jgi:hypothetical protein